MMTNCRLCPRNCGAVRGETGTGVCRSGERPVIARAAPHFGEEPCISGERGSGTVFFSGCNLGCVFCQNQAISRESVGEGMDIPSFRDMLLRLVQSGVHNINLVTPTHFTAFIAEALTGFDPGVPVCWNSSGYESPEALRLLEGKVAVYMPDFKYGLSAVAARYAHAPDYPAAAKRAILEMYRQTGPYELDEAGLLRRGVLIRHLVLPEQADNTFEVIDWVAETFPPGSVLFSLMSQYTPVAETPYPELRRTLRDEEYARVCAYMEAAGILDGFYQEKTSATGEMIPEFDGTGVWPKDR